MPNGNNSLHGAPLAAAKNTRHDMKGNPRHPDVITTTWQWRHRGVKHDALLGNFLSDVETRDLELILSGAVCTYSRRAHSQIPDPRGEVIANGWCRHCYKAEAIEDPYHLFWQCPAWAGIRER